MSADPNDYLPSATLPMLRLRARLLRAVREFFDGRGYFEVDTPLLAHDRAIDPHLAPFVVEHRAGPLYLQTSPEFAMKRLLAAGAEAIYQIGHVFRADELGKRHNPEFTMVEWYRAGDTYMEQMQVVEDLVVAVFRAAVEARATASQTPFDVKASQVPAVPFRRTSYRDAFAAHAGRDGLLLGPGELAELARSRHVAVPESLEAADRDGWLNLLLAELVEPNLGIDRPEFLFDYPVSQAALARIRREDPPVAERFELYIGGVELCNGYHELTDAGELRRRIDAESQRRVAGGDSPLPVSNRLLAAMDAGLPACAGVALGFDRLMMLAAGASSVADVLPFPFDRA
jgi:lysyl-tRNA synthetase class 2